MSQHAHGGTKASRSKPTPRAETPEEIIGLPRAIFAPRAEAAWAEILEALENGLSVAQPAPDPDPHPTTAMRRATTLVRMLADAEPRLDWSAESWQERGKLVSNLDAALRAVIRSTPHAGPEFFSHVRPALVQARLAVEREIAWRRDIDAKPEGERSMHFSVRGIWSVRTKKGARPTKRVIAAVARQYGLGPVHLALLESALRIEIAPWDTAVLPPLDASKLYLRPLPGGIDDELANDSVIDRWKKAMCEAPEK